MGRPAEATRVESWIPAPGCGRSGRRAQSAPHCADAPGNVALPAHVTNLPKDSVANVSQVLTLDKELLTERVGKLSRAKLELVLSGIDVMLGR